MELPADEIKIDRSFGMRMNEEHDDVAIVRSTIDLSRNLGLDVVAEGVETREIWDKLQELGCQTAQGYYLSRPSSGRHAHRMAARPLAATPGRCSRRLEDRGPAVGSGLRQRPRCVGGADWFWGASERERRCRHP